MISSLHIEGYRGFDQFDMDRLGRINLLVGKNNSGKTSILEAVYLLFACGSSDAIALILRSRGERLPDISPVHGTGSDSLKHIELDVRHLFKGHTFISDSSFKIAALENGEPRELTLSLTDRDAYIEGAPNATARRRRRDRDVASINLEAWGSPRPDASVISLSEKGGLDSFTAGWRSPRYPAKFIFINSLSSDQLVPMWNAIALTPMEDTVLKALRAVDPGIERIATQVSGPIWAPIGRDGFVVKSKGADHPVPIGSMGDGMWRMLALAIAMSQCQDGVLLVDEIDTGLHYSLMLKMWTLLYSAARELNVQVFATSHSDECIHSLAQLATASENGEHVSVQRIEPARRRSISFDRDEIAVAAASDVEIR